MCVVELCRVEMGTKYRCAQYRCVSSIGVCVWCSCLQLCTQNLEGFEFGKGGALRGCFCPGFSKVNQHFVLGTDFQFVGSHCESVLIEGREG